MCPMAGHVGRRRCRSAGLRAGATLAYVAAHAVGADEILADLFRTCEELAPELLRRCADLELAYDRAELGSIDLLEVVSTEYRADAVIILREHGNAARAAVVMEV